MTLSVKIMEYGAPFAQNMLKQEEDANFTL